MNHQLVRNAGLILMFSFLAACTGTDTKTGGEANKDSLAAKPTPFDVLGMVHRAATGSGAGPVMPMTVQYGIKAGSAQRCSAGAGICNVTGTSPGVASDTLQVVGGSLVIATDTALLDRYTPLYDSFNRYGFNGVLSYDAAFNFGRTLSKRLGVADSISIKKGMPMAFMNASNESAPGKLTIVTFGAIPGNSARVTFSNCAGNPYSFSLSLAAADSDSIGRAYTGFYDPGDGSGTLVIYMRTEHMPGMGDCMPHQDPGSLAATFLNFRLAGDVEINPNTTSIPTGSVISAAQNDAQQLAIYPTGWCMLTLTVTVPSSPDKVTKK